MGTLKDHQLRTIAKEHIKSEEHRSILKNIKEYIKWHQKEVQSVQGFISFFPWDVMEPEGSLRFFLSRYSTAGRENNKTVFIRVIDIKDNSLIDKTVSDPELSNMIKENKIKLELTEDGKKLAKIFNQMDRNRLVKNTFIPWFSLIFAAVAAIASVATLIISF